jgi:hypothetical protein
MMTPNDNLCCFNCCEVFWLGESRGWVGVENAGVFLGRVGRWLLGRLFVMVVVGWIGNGWFGLERLLGWIFS